MPYSFRVIFGGLCALVPGEDHLDVLLVNTEHTRVRELHNKPDLHRPKLQFELGDMLGDSGTPGFGTWPLDFEELTISAPGKNDLKLREIKHQLADVPEGASGLTRVNSGEGRDDLAWIPDLKKVCPAVGSLERDCLAEHPNMRSKDAFIKSRLRVDQGVVRSFEMASYQNREVMIEFVPKIAGNGSKRAALPHLAAVELEIDDRQSVTMRATKFDGSSQRSIELGPPRAGKNAISVFLTNLCCGGGYYDEPKDELPTEDADFECFYILYDNFEQELTKFARLPIPVPVDFRADPSPVPAVSGGGNPVRCSMARLERD